MFVNRLRVTDKRIRVTSVRIIFRTDNRPVPIKRKGQRETPGFYRVALAITIGLAIIAIVGSLLTEGGLSVIYRQARLKSELKAKIASEEIRRQDLMDRVEALKHDQFELERVAREELGLVRENEVVFDFRESGLD